MATELFVVLSYSPPSPPGDPDGVWSLGGFFRSEADLERILPDGTHAIYKGSSPNAGEPPEGFELQRQVKAKTPKARLTEV